MQNGRRLAGYIGVTSQPQNKSRESIAMTAPVITIPKAESIAMTTPVISSSQFMAFTLPSMYNLSTAPIPSDPSVTLEEVPGALKAVTRFSGLWNMKNCQPKLEELFETLRKDNLRFKVLLLYGL